jgi:carboxylate-amine ligase
MDIMDRIKTMVTENPVFLFMKGTPQFPQCGYSSRTAQALAACGREFAHVNVLADPEVFENLPRTGLPPVFRSWSEYENFIATIIRTGAIEEPTQIWWDIRPHPKYPTLEFRQSDICTTIDEAICVASLIVAIVAKLIKLRLGNMSWRPYRQHLIEENKWRAVRWGLDGTLIDFGKQESVPTRDLIEELLELVDDVLDELDLREEVEYARTIMEQGTSADRQLATFRETGDLKGVVDQLVRETRQGV